MTMTRRNLLCRTAPALAMIPIGLALDGCSGLTAAVALAPQIAQYAGVIANAISSVLPTIAAITGLGSNVVNTITGIVGEISSVAGSIATATTNTAPGLITQLGSGIGTIAGLLSGVKSLPGIVDSVIQDAMALLPAIESLVGIAPKVAARHLARFASVITPEQAYNDLRLIAAGQRR